MTDLILEESVKMLTFAKGKIFVKMCEGGVTKELQTAVRKIDEVIIDLRRLEASE